VGGTDSASVPTFSAASCLPARLLQEISAAASSQMNTAYRVLRNPATRAQYLLQLHGIDAIGEAAGALPVTTCAARAVHCDAAARRASRKCCFSLHLPRCRPAGTTHVDPELLMEVLEAREALTDPTTPVAAVDALQRGVQATILRLVSDITKAFAGKDLTRAWPCSTTRSCVTRWKSGGRRAGRRRRHLHLLRRRRSLRRVTAPRVLRAGQTAGTPTTSTTSSSTGRRSAGAAASASGFAMTGLPATAPVLNRRL